MKSLKKTPHQILVLIFISVYTIGCYPSTRVAITKIAPVSKTIPTKSPVIYKDGEIIQRPFEVIAILSVHNGTKPIQVTKRMRKEGKELGADALINFILERDIDDTRYIAWARALAVRFKNNDSINNSALNKFTILIPHTDFTAVLKKERQLEIADEQMRKIALRMLSAKGYYVILTDEEFPKTLFNSSATFDITKNPGYQGDLIMGLRSVERKKMTVVVATGEAHQIEGILYSGSKNEAMWKNNAIGAGTAGWLVNMDKGFRIHLALDAAFREMIKTLPDVNTIKK